MAVIESFDFSITRTSFPDGHICNVDYNYFLHVDKNQYDEKEIFSIAVELHGDDVMRDKTIGEPPYDAHLINVLDSMPQKRKFVIDCDLLDETWGEDHIYLKIFVHSNHGERITEKTATIKDWF